MKERYELYEKETGKLLSFAERDLTTEEILGKRRAEYPDIGDQLDALWKQLNQDRLDGKPLIQEADDRLNEILAVKAKYPKPEKDKN
ncbi:MAG: hypothetical protein IT558_00785 [Alphaproteobacteria bacterium]|nr:hypothetical protein [Alphaproteobacteria bacterium]